MRFFEKINNFWPARKFFKPHDADIVLGTLEELIDDEIHVDSDSHERTLLRNVLDLRDITAWDVMVPRADITAIDVKTPIPELVSEMVKMAHSRLPCLLYTSPSPRD